MKTITCQNIRLGKNGKQRCGRILAQVPDWVINGLTDASRLTLFCGSCRKGSKIVEIGRDGDGHMTFAVAHGIDRQDDVVFTKIENTEQVA